VGADLYVAAAENYVHGGMDDRRGPVRLCLCDEPEDSGEKT
jgi:hypothetical protein